MTTIVLNEGTEIETTESVSTLNGKIRSSELQKSNWIEILVIEPKLFGFGKGTLKKTMVNLKRILYFY